MTHQSRYNVLTDVEINRLSDLAVGPGLALIADEVAKGYEVGRLVGAKTWLRTEQLARYHVGLARSKTGRLAPCR